jgi:hypothetical protein
MLIRVVRMTFKEESVGEFLENFEANKEKIRNFPDVIIWNFGRMKTTSMFLQLIAIGRTKKH